MILKNNGKVIQEVSQMNEKTRKHLSKFWKLPEKKEIEDEREKLQGYDKQWALAKKNFTQSWIQDYESSFG